jgi:hypothetical protein
MLHENGPALEDNENLTNGIIEEPQSGDFLGWMRGLQARFFQGMADKFEDSEQKRAAAVHTAKLILGDGGTTGEYLVVADYILYGKNAMMEMANGSQ